MITATAPSLSLYQFQLLQQFPERVAHGIFGRLNVSPSFAKNGEVALHRRRMLEALGGGGASAISLAQVHGADVAVVKHPAHIEALRDEQFSADAMVTALPEVPLLIKTADCQAILLFSTQGVIANVHAGWRGLVRGVIPETIRAMREAFHVAPGTIFAGISPSLGPCCAEFTQRDAEFPMMFQKYFMPNARVNLWWAAVDLLVSCGVPREQIEVAGLCSVCHRDTFFSHRGDVADSGRGGSVIFLRKTAYGIGTA